MKYKIISDRIPYDGMYHGYNGDLVPDWEPTVRKLKETIYGADVLDEEGNVVTPTQETETADTTTGSETDTQNTEATGDSGQVTWKQKSEREIRPHRLSVEMMQMGR